MATDEHLWLKTPWPLHLLLAGLAIGWSVLFGNPFQVQDDQWFDQSLRFRHASGFAQAVDDRLVHLDITQSDLASLPTTESEYDAAARLILEATELGAVLIVMDVVYSRGSREIAQPVLDAIKQSQGVVLAAGSATLPGSEVHEERIRSFPFLSVPYAPAGLINIQADRDGIYRRYQRVHRTSEGLEPSLALAAYLAFQDVRWPNDLTFRDPQTARWKELSPDGTRLVAKELKLTHPDGVPLLDFRSGWSDTGPAAFPHVTLTAFYDLHRHFRATGGPRPLEGKILFVSYVASGVSDFGATPFGSHQPLVHLHSTALNDLLQGTARERVPPWVEALLLASVLILGCGAAVASTKRVLIGFWLSGVLATLGTGMAFVFTTRWIIPSVAVTAVWTIALVTELLRRHTYELVQRLKLRTVMGYYFSPRVLNRVLANPGSMEPQQAELTVLLTDLRNFTTLAERLGTRGIFELCNQVFAVQTKAVMDEDGSLDHFSGDQFLSYWGAPDPQPEATDRALRASFALIRAMEQLRHTLAPEVQKLFGYGVAFHTGTAFVGNLGSKRRMDYGLIGDLINSAARVESLTKYYGVPFLITREAYNKLSHRPPCRWLDSVFPVGKSRPLDLLEVEHPLSGPDFQQKAQEYAIAFNHYRKGDFATARTALLKIGEQYGDQPGEVLAERCRQFMAKPPERWTGIYRLTTK